MPTNIHLPSWIKRELFTPIRAREATTFLLHGDIGGLIPNPRVDLPERGEDVRSRRRFADLPSAAKGFVDFLQEALNLLVRLLSVGPTSKDKPFLH